MIYELESSVFGEDRTIDQSPLISPHRIDQLISYPADVQELRYGSVQEYTELYDV